jgi:hypothetical protein
MSDEKIFQQHLFFAGSDGTLLNNSTWRSNPAIVKTPFSDVVIKGIAGTGLGGNGAPGDVPILSAVCKITPAVRSAFGGSLSDSHFDTALSDPCYDLRAGFVPLFLPLKIDNTFTFVVWIGTDAVNMNSLVAANCQAYLTIYYQIKSY